VKAERREVAPSRIASSGVNNGRAIAGSEILAPKLEIVRWAWRTVVIQEVDGSI